MGQQKTRFVRALQSIGHCLTCFTAHSQECGPPEGLSANLPWTTDLNKSKNYSRKDEWEMKVRNAELLFMW